MTTQPTPARPWEPLPDLACRACSAQATVLVQAVDDEGHPLYEGALSCEKHWIDRLNDALETSGRAGVVELRKRWREWFLHDTTAGRVVSRCPVRLEWAPGGSNGNTQLGIALCWTDRRLLTTGTWSGFEHLLRLSDRLHL